MPRKIDALIVEDSEEIIEILKIRVAPFGIDLTAANSAEEAFGKLEQEQFQMALIDINLPSMDGIQLLEKIRAKDQRILPVILTSDKTTMRVLEAQIYGAFDYIYKPSIAKGELDRVLTRACDHIERWQEIRRTSQKKAV